MEPNGVVLKLDIGRSSVLVESVYTLSTSFVTSTLIVFFPTISKSLKWYMLRRSALVSMQFDLEVLTAVLLKIQVLCVLMPCRMVDVLLGLLDPEDEGATILRNVSNAYQLYQSYQST